MSRPLLKLGGGSGDILSDVLHLSGVSEAATSCGVSACLFRRGALPLENRCCQVKLLATLSGSFANAKLLISGVCWFSSENGRISINLNIPVELSSVFL